MRKLINKFAVLLIKVVERLVHPHRYCSEAFVQYLKKNGAKIGCNTFFVAPKTTDVDTRRLNYITIGAGCCITSGVQLLCHDFSWSVLRKSHDVILPDPGHEIKLGDNVFLGWNSIVMPGVTIGSNVIIGAHSVVTKDVPSNCVCVGNPARVICSLDDYCKKRKERVIQDAFSLARFVYKEKKRNPSIREMGWFGILFLERTKTNENFLRSLPFRADSMDEVIRVFYSTKPSFENFDDFLSKMSLKS